MTVTDFLQARCDEELQEVSCSYSALPTGSFECLCDRPDGGTLELLAKASIVHRWENAPDKRPLLQILAADYAWHPDYRPEWRSVL
jgi:hypothetical protein